MDPNLIEIKGNLVDGQIDIPIDVKYTSKYSLLIRFLNTNNFRDGKEFSNLVLRRNGNSYNLGQCRFVSEPNINGYAGRIICVNDVELPMQPGISPLMLLSLKNKKPNDTVLQIE